MSDDPTRRAFLAAAAAAGPALALPACKVCPAPPPPIRPAAEPAGDLLGEYTKMVAAVEAARSAFADRLIAGLGPRWLDALTRHEVKAEPLSRAEWARREAGRLLPPRPVRIVTPRFTWDCEDYRPVVLAFNPETCGATALGDDGRILYPAAVRVPFATMPTTVYVRGGARTFVGFLDAILGTLAAEVRFHLDEATRYGPVTDPVVSMPRADVALDACLVQVFFRVLVGHGPLLA